MVNQRQLTKQQTMTNKTLHRKLKTEQQDSTKTKGEDQTDTYIYTTGEIQTDTYIYTKGEDQTDTYIYTLRLNNMTPLKQRGKIRQTNIYILRGRSDRQIYIL